MKLKESPFCVSETVSLSAAHGNIARHCYYIQQANAETFLDRDRKTKQWYHRAPYFITITKFYWTKITFYL
jgi:hypothetical protein